MVLVNIVAVLLLMQHAAQHILPTSKNLPHVIDLLAQHIYFLLRTDKYQMKNISFYVLHIAHHIYLRKTRRKLTWLLVNNELAAMRARIRSPFYSTPLELNLAILATACNKHLFKEKRSPKIGSHESMLS